MISYGAIIQSIRQPDKDNQITEITLGYDTLQGKQNGLQDTEFVRRRCLEYVDDQSFFGATVGRVASRIKNGRFELDGKVYELDKSDSTKENGDTVVFKYQSPDGKYLICIG